VYSQSHFCDCEQMILRFVRQLSRAIKTVVHLIIFKLGPSRLNTLFFDFCLVIITLLLLVY
jgi:hypothetical protein